MDGDDVRRGSPAWRSSTRLLFAGCTVQSVRDPCFFDPPPGDQYTRTISNDSSFAISLVACDDGRCRRGYNDVTVSPGQTADVIVEACSVETYAVTEPTTHKVLGCLHQEGDELGTPSTASDRKVSRIRACAGAKGPYRIDLYNPGG